MANLLSIWERKEKGMKKIIVVTFIAVLWASLALAGERVVYIVKKGDTLGELMYSWHAQGVEIKKLFLWNQDLGTQIRIGQNVIYYLPDSPEIQARELDKAEIKNIVAETLAQIELKAPSRQIQPSVEQNQRETVGEKAA